MTLATDAALAELSLAAYSATPALPTGFAPAVLPGLPASGLFQNGNAAALVATANLEGKETIVIAFRGTDDQTDSLHDLQNINLDYPLFAGLVAQVDFAAATYGFDQVVVTGHSLGGAFAQLYLQAHPDRPGGLTFDAVTFGSPGAILPAGGDARPANYIIADDPAPFLGTHRAELGEVLRANATLAGLAADAIAAELPGLTRDQALASLGSLTVDYENRGDIILLPGRDQNLSPANDVAGLSRLAAAQHAPELYVAALEAAASRGGPEIFIPTAPQGNAGLAFLRSLYDSDQRDPTAAGQVVADVLDGWAHGLGQGAETALADAFTSLRDGLGGIGRDILGL